MRLSQLAWQLELADSPGLWEVRLPAMYLLHNDCISAAQRLHGGYIAAA